MKLAIVLGLALIGKATGCCTTDSDCVELMSPADVEYNMMFDKTLECDQDCPGLINCNMFGLCEQCRGCFETCDGAAKFMEETSAPADFITFCSGVGISDLSECDGASGAGSGSATSDGVGSASGSGMDSAAEEITAGYGSGAGSGSASMSSSKAGSASGSGMDSAADDITAGYGSGAGSGSGSMSSSMATASGSGEASRIADIDGCDCGTADLEPSFAAYFCENGKSMYCDLECVDGADPDDFLFPSLGGLWCQPEGWEGCRMCKFDCSDYEGENCVPCPPGLKNWC